MALRGVVLALSFCLLTATPSGARDRETLGWGRIFSNDAIGDGRDRWRTGSYMASWVTGPAWDGALPARPGDLVEFRFRGEILAPANLETPAAGDRRYVGLVSFGAHTQFAFRGFEIGGGADFVVTGPQTRAGDFQTRVHEILDIPPPGRLDTQLPDNLYPTAVVEVARPVTVTPRLSFRPFVEAQAGAETFLRLGADLRIGRVGSDALHVRDPVTGHRVGVNRDRNTGFSAVLGLDAAYVVDSVFLDPADGVTLTDVRLRGRAGVLWQSRRASVFYGLTWLGQEFDAQTRGQVVGSLQLKLRF